MSARPHLLTSADPAPWGVDNPDGPSPVLFVADHAGRAIPERLGDLGLPEDERSRHIGYDIGIHGVTRALARALDATYVFQPYSRLVIDCNRQPGKPQSVMVVSDTTPIPGNAGLASGDVAAREHEILRPYQARVGEIIAARTAARRPTVLFAMHSCTDRLRGEALRRPWHFSVIADRDWRVGDALVALMRERTGFTIGINQPYVVDMEADYTLPVHAVAGGLPYVEIEIRQDLITDAEGQAEWAALLSVIVPEAVARSGVATAA